MPRHLCDSLKGLSSVHVFVCVSAWCAYIKNLHTECVIVHGDAYVSDLHYLQKATENDCTSSLVAKAHRWNLGKGQQDEEAGERVRCRSEKRRGLC